MAASGGFYSRLIFRSFIWQQEPGLALGTCGSNVPRPGKPAPFPRPGGVPKKRGSSALPGLLRGCRRVFSTYSYCGKLESLFKEKKKKKERSQKKERAHLVVKLTVTARQHILPLHQQDD